jgi:hypothetical protein
MGKLLEKFAYNFMKIYVNSWRFRAYSRFGGIPGHPKTSVDERSGGK